MSNLTMLTELDLRSAAAASCHALALPPALAALSGLKALCVTADRHSPIFGSLFGITRCGPGLSPLTDPTS